MSSRECFDKEMIRLRESIMSDVFKGGNYFPLLLTFIYEKIEYPKVKSFFVPK